MNLDLHRAWSYRCKVSNSLSFDESPPVAAVPTGDGRRLTPTEQLRKQRQEWGKRWGEINSQIGKRLREGES